MSKQNGVGYCIIIHDLYTPSNGISKVFDRATVICNSDTGGPVMKVNIDTKLKFGYTWEVIRQ